MVRVRVSSAVEFLRADGLKRFCSWMPSRVTRHVDVKDGHRWVATLLTAPARKRRQTVPLVSR